jgi:hypothetical protein
VERFANILARFASEFADCLVAKGCVVCRLYLGQGEEALLASGAARFAGQPKGLSLREPSAQRL